jgi:folate-binding protein YgfZ
MHPDLENTYKHIRSGGTGFYKQKRGLIAVWGKEAVQFLDGLISNDMKTLEDGQQMLAAFPNAQGRLLAVVRVLRQDDKFLFETEDATREKVFQNLFRFTFAGDFFVEDLSEQYRYFEMFGDEPVTSGGGGIFYKSTASTSSFMPIDSAETLRHALEGAGSIEISEELYKTLRIESGIPKYGVDMDETTIVPELGIDGLISYNKGCYIGQEIIARIHFRGHVAKQLTGLILTNVTAEPDAVSAGAELSTPDGKNAGRITSVTFSPTLKATIALGYVRYDFLADGTELRASNNILLVKKLPFVI